MRRERCKVCGELVDCYVLEVKEYSMLLQCPRCYSRFVIDTHIGGVTQ